MSDLTTTLVAATGDLPTQWLLARASGLLAYLALTLTVIAGLTLRTRLLGRAVSPAVVTAVHRSLSLVGIGALVLHAGLIALDSAVDVPLVSLVVPGLAGYRPIATGLGVAAAELWLLIHLSFRLRRRIGVARWRMLHMATFPLWGIAALHGIFAGSDSGQPWVQQLYVWSIASVVFLVAIRVGSRARPAARRPAPTPAPDTPRDSLPSTSTTQQPETASNTHTHAATAA